MRDTRLRAAITQAYNPRTNVTQIHRLYNTYRPSNTDLPEDKDYDKWEMQNSEYRKNLRFTTDRGDIEFLALLFNNMKQWGRINFEYRNAVVLFQCTDVPSAAVNMFGVRDYALYGIAEYGLWRMPLASTNMSSFYLEVFHYFHKRLKRKAMQVQTKLEPAIPKYSVHHKKDGALLVNNWTRECRYMSLWERLMYNLMGWLPA